MQDGVSDKSFNDKSKSNDFKRDNSNVSIQSGASGKSGKSGKSNKSGKSSAKSTKSAVKKEVANVITE